MIRQSTWTGRTFCTSSIQREVIHAHGHSGSNQNCTSSGVGAVADCSVISPPTVPPSPLFRRTARNPRSACQTGPRADLGGSVRRELLDLFHRVAAARAARRGEDGRVRRRGILVAVGRAAGADRQGGG